MSEINAKCPKCGGKMISKGEWETLVGYYSPPGHNHNDNCLKKVYVCERCKSEFIYSIQRKCNVPECDWVGSDSCFCHSGKKVKEWPRTI